MQKLRFCQSFMLTLAWNEAMFVFGTSRCGSISCKAKMEEVRLKVLADGRTQV